MDAYNCRVMIQCALCRETCHHWPGDSIPDPAGGEPLPICPACADRDEPAYGDGDPDFGPEPEREECEACGGTGWVSCGQFDGSGELSVECPEC